MQMVGYQCIPAFRDTFPAFRDILSSFCDMALCTKTGTIRGSIRKKKRDGSYLEMIQTKTIQYNLEVPN